MTLNDPQRLRLSVKSIVMDFILFQQERVEITVPIISKSKRETPTPPPQSILGHFNQLQLNSGSPLKIIKIK